MIRHQKKKEKPARITKSQSNIINKKFYGKEPEVAGRELSTSERMDIYNWYHAVEFDSALEYYIDLLSALGRDEDIIKIKTVPNDWVNRTGAWVARLIMRGAELPQDAIEFGMSKLEDTLSHAVSEPDKATLAAMAARAKASAFMSELEETIDAVPADDWSLFDYMSEAGCSTVTANYVLERLEPRLGEIIDAYAGIDPEVVEAYSRYDRPTLEFMAVLYTTMVEDVKRFLGHGNGPETAPKVRKPRKTRVKKPVAPEKQLKFIQPQAVSAEFNLTSIPAKKILGAAELWTFNTKYKTLTVFRAKSPAGLGVYRTAITNYDENTSCTKRIGRRTSEYLTTVMSNGKITLRNLMSTIKSENIKLSDRINENVVLLRTN